MQLTIKYFGRLVEATACGEQVLTVAPQTTVWELERHLRDRHPALLGQSFQVAVNRAVVASDHVLEAGDEVALLPPFSGG